VQYVELRSIDVNAYDPLGINDRQLRFLEAFLVFCLLHESPLIDAQERKDIDHNELATAHRGRDPKLQLRRKGKTIHLKEWAAEIVQTMGGVCELVDAGIEDAPYAESIARQAEKVSDPNRTPSARMLAEMRDKGEGFYHFAMRMSQQHQQYFRELEQSALLQARFADFAQQSWTRQREIEADNGESFTAYLQRYFAQTL